MNRRLGIFGATLGLLGATGVLLLLPHRAPEARLAAPLETIPTAFAGWSRATDVPRDAVSSDPNATEELLRAYRNGTESVWLSIGYYGAQSERRRPAARQLLFPGAGWTHLSERRVNLSLDGRPGATIPATLVLTRVADRTVATLYWYQIGGRSLGSDHGYRALLLYHRLVRRRTDGVLVRIASSVPAGVDVQAVVARQTGFVRALYPELLVRLPE